MWIKQPTNTIESKNTHAKIPEKIISEFVENALQSDDKVRAPYSEYTDGKMNNYARDDNHNIIPGSKLASIRIKKLWLQNNKFARDFVFCVLSPYDWNISESMKDVNIEELFSDLLDSYLDNGNEEKLNEACDAYSIIMWVTKLEPKYADKFYIEKVRLVYCDFFRRLYLRSIKNEVGDDVKISLQNNFDNS